MSQTGQIKQQMFISHLSGGWESKTKEQLDLVSGKGPPPGLQADPLFTCAHMAFPQYVHVERGLSPFLPPVRTLTHHEGPTLVSNVLNLLTSQRLGAKTAQHW